ncbi:TetR/AcrR family transcriptional regulator [Agromyces mangrovi Wang et al. 2018]|uniref:TetR/AcrR family transcriptional regulator n=1 Tax=Agromyces mangrovi TaxID=1858653 RepID=UPI002572BD2F|nr:TetR/AcrR family transcriptional regulator [Agromyces mangrovi]BDZ64689.1 TetR family transcriptional regulator [Agromyces mangrovi]
MPTDGEGFAQGRKANRGPSAGPENRRALVAAAREVFAEQGLTAPLSAVARRAGVGQGSLYRHFPDRVALALAVFDENLDALEAVVAPPDSTLDDLIELVIAQAMVSTAIIELLRSQRHDERVAELGDRLHAVVATALDREHDAGRIGAHVTVDDVELAISMLAQVLPGTDAAERRAIATRAWALFHAAFAPRG